MLDAKFETQAKHRAERLAMSFRDKPIDQITVEDIMRVIEEQTLEDSILEFKERLPAKGGGDDPWTAGGEQIGDRARNELLAEIIAFANAYGGHLILGVAESDEKPARAVATRPVPRCISLAEKLRLQARDCIEPQIPILSTTGIVTEPDGGGLVLVRVEPSRLAPHRLRQTLECYHRRADRTEKMTMREIQDLTLFRERGMTAVDAMFESRRQKFQKWMASVGNNAVALRVTLVPVTDSIHVTKLYRQEENFPAMRGFRGRFTENEDSRVDLVVPQGAYNERPIVRGVRRFGERTGSVLMQEASFNGVIDIYYSFRLEPEVRRHSIYIGWLLAYVANGLVSADTMRCQAGLPELEYALEVEVVPIIPGIPLIWFFDHANLGTIDEAVEFPRMSVGPKSEFSQIMTFIMNDLRAMVGVDVVHTNEAGAARRELPLTIEF